MSKRKFSDRERSTFRTLALEAITQKLATGFNYYPNSVELTIKNAVAIPVKYGHRSLEFIGLLEKAVTSEFKGVDSVKFPRIVVYQWLKGCNFPKEAGTKIWDISQGRYLNDEQEYNSSSEKLIAEGDEMTLVFKPSPDRLVDVVKLIMQKGSFYSTNDDGSLVPAPNGSKHPFELNPKRLSDDAYMTPMIITSFDEELATQLPAFRPVTKLYKIKENEEISVYLDKTLDACVKKCRVRFENHKQRLANKLFRDFINFEEDPRLASS